MASSRVADNSPEIFATLTSPFKVPVIIGGPRRVNDVQPLKLLVAILLCAPCIPAQTDATNEGAKAVVLQKNEGELRTRLQRENVASPSGDFLLKISQKTNG